MMLMVALSLFDTFAVETNPEMGWLPDVPEVIWPISHTDHAYKLTTSSAVHNWGLRVVSRKK